MEYLSTSTDVCVCVCVCVCVRVSVRARDYDTAVVHYTAALDAILGSGSTSSVRTRLKVLNNRAQVQLENKRTAI
jgi:hypothetical protein